MAVEAQNVKVIRVIDPAAIVDNASWTTEEIDTKGFDYCQVHCFVGATDIAHAALKVQESDTSGSGFADVTGLVFGTSTNTDGSTSTLPSATDDNKFFIFDIDLRGRKRFLDLVATAGNGALGTFMAAWAVLSRAGETPMTAAERGASQILRV
jgi:hypothetical protein